MKQWKFHQSCENEQGHQSHGQFTHEWDDVPVMCRKTNVSQRCCAIDRCDNRHTAQGTGCDCEKVKCKRMHGNNDKM